jgi:hypothetical protein
MSKYQKHCKLCGTKVKAGYFCWGCRSWICDECDVSQPWDRKHSVDEHLAKGGEHD